MFDSEEKVLESAQKVLDNSEEKESFLYVQYKKLYEQYKKLFKQFSMLVRVSDRQYRELIASRETIRKYNDDLTTEIKERKNAQASLMRANQELNRMARLDSLTQIANRLRFDEYLKQQWSAMSRDTNPICLIICDIDYFKKYNDEFGHPAGDACLKKVAQALNRCAQRPADLVARYGGEEFAVILPATDAEGAYHVARSIRQEICSLCIHHPKSCVSDVITVSQGVAEFFPAQKEDYEELISLADQALYEAKENGRNQIIVKKEKKKTAAPGFNPHLLCSTN